MGKRVNHTSLKKLASKTLGFGWQGENLHTKVIIDCSDLLQDYPDAEVEIRAIMPGSQEIYKPEITVSDGRVTWEFTQAELARNGFGQMQLTFTNGEEVIKSDVGSFTINESL